MERTELINDIKLNLRIVTNDFNDEIDALIDEAVSDIIKSASIENENLVLSNLLAISAIKTYVKGNFGTNEKREEYIQSYQSQLGKLGLQNDIPN